TNGPWFYCCNFHCRNIESWFVGKDKSLKHWNCKKDKYHNPIRSMDGWFSIDDYE
ncbi:8112_t:CDS:1, partial [Dentiscutata erythropus]